MFGTKCARKVLAELAAASATPAAETPAAKMCEACKEVDVSALPSSRICEGCSTKLMQCQRCRHGLGKHRVTVTAPAPRTTPVCTGTKAEPLAANPLVTVFKPERKPRKSRSKSAGGGGGSGTGGPGGGVATGGGDGPGAGGGGAGGGHGSGGGVAGKEVVFTLPSHQEISDRAFFMWKNSGCTHGHNVDDWLEAERQLIAERTTPVA